MCVRVGVSSRPVTNPFCFCEHVCLGHGNDSCSATDRERGGEGGLSGWRVGGSGPLKRKNGVFNIFDMQATSDGAQQLRRREFKLVRIRNVSQSSSGSERGKEQNKGREVGRRRFTSLVALLKTNSLGEKGGQTERTRRGRKNTTTGWEV